MLHNKGGIDYAGNQYWYFHPLQTVRIYKAQGKHRAELQMDYLISLFFPPSLTLRTAVISPTQQVGFSKHGFLSPSIHRQQQHTTISEHFVLQRTSHKQTPPQAQDNKNISLLMNAF